MNTTTTGAPFSAAAYLRAKAEAFAQEHGSVDPETNALEFRRGAHAEEKSVYFNELLELADELDPLEAKANAGRVFHAVIATRAKQGVLFDHIADAQWTHTGEGTGSDGFGVPTVGEEFRDCYADEPLELVLVRVVEGGAA